MAEVKTSLRERLKSIITCDICEGLLDEPHEWPCLHHSCLKCIPQEETSEQNGDLPYVLCPKCQCKCSRDEVNSKPLLESIISTVKQEDESIEQVRFQVADDSEASEISQESAKLEGLEECVDDVQSNSTSPQKHSQKAATLGESLTEADLSLAATRQTTYGPRVLSRYNTLPVTTSPMSEPAGAKMILYRNDESSGDGGDSVIVVDGFCENHEDNKVIYLCVTCKEVICAKCRYVSHQKHLILPIKEAFQKEKDTLMDNMKLIHAHRETMSKQLTEIESLEERKRQNRQAILASISDTKANILQRVEADYKALCTEIEEQFDSQLSELQCTKSEMQKCVQTNDNTCSWTDSLLAKVGGSEVLREIKDELNEKIASTIDSLGSSNVDDIDICDSEVRFTPYKPDCNLIGTLSEVTISEVDFELLEVDSNDSSSQNSGNAGLPVAELATRNLETFSLTHLVKDSGTQIRSFKLSKWCHRLCYFQEKIWCPSCFSNVIDIYEVTGKFVRSIVCKDAGSCRAVQPVKQHKLAVASKKGLFIVNTEGKQQLKLFSGTFRDVSANDEVIVAVRERGNYCDTIQVLSTADFAVKHTFTLKNSFCKRLIVKEEDLFVSFHEPYKQSFVSVYEFTGNEKFQSGIHGRGVNKVDCPLLGCIDSDDTVLVADVYNSYLQIMDKQGKWTRVKQQSKHPYDALIIEGDQLLILCNDNASTKFNVVGGSHVYVYQL